MKHKLKAVTLIETVVYLALFGAIFLFLAQYLFSVSESDQIGEYRKEFEKGIIFVNEHINDTFSKSSAIDVANSTFANNSGKIRVTIPGGYNEYSIQNNQLVVNNNGTITPITAPEIYVTKFYLEQVQNSKSVLVGTRATIEFTASKKPNVKTNYVTSYVIK